MRNPRYRLTPHARGQRRSGRIASVTACAETAADYAYNLLVGTRLAWAGAGHAFYDLATDEILVDALRRLMPRLAISATTDGDALRKRLRRALERTLHRSVVPAALPEPVLGNVGLLASLLGLDAVEKDVLQFLVVHRLVKTLEDLTDEIGALSLVAAAALVGSAIAREPDDVLPALGPKARLASSGIVTIDDEPNSLESKLQVRRSLVDLVLMPHLDRAQLLARLLPAAPSPTLTTDDFAHLAAPVELARRLLAEALRTHRPGVNILFYGATGSGKTELARLLATTVGTSLHAAGTEDDDGNSADADERMSSLLLGNRLLAGTPSLLLFDEAEDLFERDGFAGLLLGTRRDKTKASKLWLNLLLETNPVPTIWIANDVDGTDPAFRRRFAFAIEFRPPGVAQRRRAWRRHLGDTLADADVERLAERFVVSAGHIATAVASARLVAGGEPDRATLEQIAEPLEKLLTGGDAHPGHAVARRYSFDAVNASCDLRELADQLAAWCPSDGPGLSLVLYGPPGTGKSEFVHHLGRRMERPVLVRRVSDILSPWVGVAEKNIAESFREAEQDGALLLFDEADSFLRDRRTARASWEVTQVNEFLEQLEEYRGVVACTTNLWRDLDQASLRRFVFKVEFRFATPAQAVQLYRTILEPLLPTPLSIEEVHAVEAALKQFVNLTPGDFAAVARRTRALGRQPAALTLVDALRAEVEAKEGAARAIGFGQ